MMMGLGGGAKHASGGGGQPSKKTNETHVAALKPSVIVLKTELGPIEAM
jgi:hypothetical protein